MGILIRAIAQGRRIVSSLLPAVVVEGLVRFAAAATRDRDQETVEVVASSFDNQILAQLIYAKYGIAGVASAYDMGLVNVENFALTYCLATCRSYPPYRGEAIGALEDKIKSEGTFFSLPFSGSTDAGDLSSDTAALGQMFTFLTASTQ